MNITITARDTEIVRQACKDALSEPSRGNTIRATEIVRDYDNVVDHFSKNYKDMEAIVGKVLASAEWSSKWGTGENRYYVIDLEQL